MPIQNILFIKLLVNDIFIIEEYLFYIPDITLIRVKTIFTLWRNCRRFCLSTRH